MFAKPGSVMNGRRFFCYCPGEHWERTVKHTKFCILAWLFFYIANAESVRSLIERVLRTIRKIIIMIREKPNLEEC